MAKLSSYHQIIVISQLNVTNWQNTIQRYKYTQQNALESAELVKQYSPPLSGTVNLWI